jgi:hypothetical protein
VNPRAWIWLFCVVALLIAAGLAFAGDLYPAVIVLILVSGALFVERRR